MEHSLSSLSFKGSIMEAITQAKQQKKLFVVYLSGDNPESNRLETCTWTDSIVAESVTKYCVLLHIAEGSTDAANFSAIYPQKPAPCITAIGYNGLKVWQSEGFVAGDSLASNLEKTWLSLQIQETAATFFTASLASRNELASGTSNSASSGSSSTINLPSPQTDRTIQSPEVSLGRNSENLKEKDDPEDKVEKRNAVTGDLVSPTSPLVKSTTETTTGSSVPVQRDPNEGRLAAEGSSSDDSIGSQEIAYEGKKAVQSSGHTNLEVESSSGHQVLNNSIDPRQTAIEAKEAVLTPGASNVEVESSFSPHVFSNSKDSQEIADEAKETVQMAGAANVAVDTASVSHSCTSGDVNLHIRLPDGSSLRVKFSMGDTLAMVKDYVDENQASSFGSFDLAVPYPRKVFDDKDLGKELSELGLSNRQALMVVMRQKAASHPRGGQSSRDQTNRDGSGTEGYWGLVKRMVSYINPLSYLGGSTSSSNPVQDTQSGVWQYAPNPSLQNDPRGAGSRPYAAYSPNQSTPSASSSSNSRSRQQRPSRFGSNIHTLKHDEDDSRFSGRNAFWNGNSTQFGGDNDDDK